jgi:hypothetical protein
MLKSADNNDLGLKDKEWEKTSKIRGKWENKAGWEAWIRTKIS